MGTKAVKGAVNFADSAIKTGTKLVKEFGEYAKKNPWEVAKMVTHGALDVLGFDALGNLEKETIADYRQRFNPSSLPTSPSTLPSFNG